jgi:hypothetical protein
MFNFGLIIDLMAEASIPSLLSVIVGFYCFEKKLPSIANLFQQVLVIALLVTITELLIAGKMTTETLFFALAYSLIINYLIKVKKIQIIPNLGLWLLVYLGIKVVLEASNYETDILIDCATLLIPTLFVVILRIKDADKSVLEVVFFFVLVLGYAYVSRSTFIGALLFVAVTGFFCWFLYFYLYRGIILKDSSSKFFFIRQFVVTAFVFSIIGMPLFIVMVEKVKSGNEANLEKYRILTEIALTCEIANYMKKTHSEHCEILELNKDAINFCQDKLMAYVPSAKRDEFKYDVKTIGYSKRTEDLKREITRNITTQENSQLVCSKYTTNINNQFLDLFSKLENK